MRRAVRLILLCVSLQLLVCAARAQPAQPPRDEPCHTAGQRYFWAFENRKHMSVEEVQAAALGAGKKYLRVCGEREDDFTRRRKSARPAQSFTPRSTA